MLPRLLDQIADTLWFIAALILSAAPRSTWRSMDARLPLERVTAASGIVTVFAAFAIGVPGFFKFAGAQASASNTWMLDQLSHGGSDSAAMAPYGISVLTFFIYAFFTPRGLFSTYLATSGMIRAIAASVDDPRGDPILSIAYGAAMKAAGRTMDAHERRTREALEGDATPDVLQTGEWAGLKGVDYVVLASRRKPEWTLGAIVLTSTDWYKLGQPFDIETPAGLRRAYPLTKMETVEVVRRGIQYELPRLQRTPRRPGSGAPSAS